MHYHSRHVSNQSPLFLNIAIYSKNKPTTVSTSAKPFAVNSMSTANKFQLGVALIKHKNVFLGKEAVDWASKRLKLSRNEAVHVLRLVQVNCFLRF